MSRSSSSAASSPACRATCSRPCVQGGIAAAAGLPDRDRPDRGRDRRRAGRAAAHPGAVRQAGAGDARQSSDGRRRPEHARAAAGQLGRHDPADLRLQHVDLPEHDRQLLRRLDRRPGWQVDRELHLPGVQPAVHTGTGSCTSSWSSGSPTSTPTWCSASRTCPRPCSGRAASSRAFGPGRTPSGT